jgi:hypothetical protein
LIASCSRIVPEHVPRERRGGKIGEDVTETLEHVPSR